MFTGIVEGVGKVLSLEEREEAWRLLIEVPFEEGGGLEPGDSLSVSGCCLTVVVVEGSEMGFDLLEETLSRTNLEEAREGHSLNLERSLPADGRVGGHFVTGHVDCTGEVLAFEERGKNFFLQVGVPDQFSHFLVDKGSIALDGCSLTVCEVDEDSFCVWLIPHTLSLTTLESLQVGARVNLEFDLLAKYVERISCRQ